MAEDHAEGPRDHQRGTVLRGGRHPGPTATPSARTTRNVPEIFGWLLGKEAAPFPKVLNE